MKHALIKHEQENPGKPACLLRDSGRVRFWPAEGSRQNSAGWLWIVFITLIETAVQIVVDSNERIGQRFN